MEIGHYEPRSNPINLTEKEAVRVTLTAHWYWHVKQGYVVIHALLDVDQVPSVQPKTTVLCVTASLVMLEILK
ncbi:hypothetical protein E2C01_070888 [Portunus trituberculatus]|uniref:Uncharacterized protein n=1 Tax=Portunus trituberculatus TaxID=210409 RepID=A0A5B7I2U4_PORTR|nr:hypothetical protein [Portunus trituberculatus]